MKIRTVTPADAAALAAIYAPVVQHTAISFETEPPDAAEMAARVVKTLPALPWLVAEDAVGRVVGYAYAGRHRERTAYQWSVDTTVYVREDRRGQGVGRALYGELLPLLADLGYCQAFAGIALPNAGSVGLHEAMGFMSLGVFRDVGFKHGAWRDVGWWQKTLRPLEEEPTVPRSFAERTPSRG
ncbi:arsinothricin resistance N-acetyltransferase ArsN1 family B [Pelomonas cellulosilytica]|uniref:N-acetyltransferase family protein n=1 Tax=Pelomonas cellulosilytica TaxID=2906762 RepID=A0ABS8XWG8_9BURK|nr:arsinothricin resistance N-acetyltransferase ArsN1 family B [Pelomonas sp. P8]MCE4555640.1 N-acetyltransferase family protein [Pelomonas sp. P8]